MGCDIHCYIEIKKDNKWYIYDWKHKYRREDFANCEDERNYDWQLLFDDPLYINRNYDLFSILADVRNGYGFAGCKTSDGFVPISQPKGIPVDASEEYSNEVEYWSGDGHSHSWLTVKELVDYNWNNWTKHTGWVNAITYKKWLDQDKIRWPEEYCGGVSGKDIKHLSEEDMANYVLNTKESLDKSWYCQCEWKESYIDSAKHFYNVTLPKLKEIADENGGYENVRLVFFFDN